jgi:hypothetical protein
MLSQKLRSSARTLGEGPLVKAALFCRASGVCEVTCVALLLLITMLVEEVPRQKEFASRTSLAVSANSSSRILQQDLAMLNSSFTQGCAVSSKKFRPKIWANFTKLRSS